MGSFFSKPSSNTPAPKEPDLQAQRAVLHRDPSRIPPSAVATSDDNAIHLSLGWRVYDASGGAAVSCLGHRFKRRIWAAVMETIDYAATTTYTTDVTANLCTRLVDSTGGILSAAVIYNSGSDAVEAAVTLARQYFLAIGQPDRAHFISREQSYHGSTGWALALSGHKARRDPFEELMKVENFHRVSSCYDYLQRGDKSIKQFVHDKAEELDRKFEEIGPGKVVAFVCEPIVGAALGCVPAVEGYLKAMQDVCRKHGALFILDEIMCGMGRTGKHLHAFLHHAGVRPDILVIGKGLAAGMQPVSAMLCSQAIVDALGKNHEGFNHGHTFQNHPPTSAAALEVLKIIDEYDLLTNVDENGKYLEKLMREKLEVLPNISPIRGQGYFQGFSVLKNKATKESFDLELHVANTIHEKGWKDPKYGIYIYPGTGSAEDGLSGDHFIVAPPFTAMKEELEWLVGRIELLLKDFFEEFETDMAEK